MNILKSYPSSSPFFLGSTYFYYCIIFSKQAQKTKSQLKLFLGVITFFPPLITKKCAMPLWTTNSTKIEHSTTKDNQFSPVRQSNGLKQTVNGSRDRHMPFYPHFLPLFLPWTTTIFQRAPHVKRHMTHWLFLLTPLTNGREENGCLW